MLSRFETSIIEDTTIHERKVRVRIPWLRLEMMLRQELIAKIARDGVPLPDGSEFKINIEQETHGSPSYSISQWYADVELKLPLAKD